MLTIGEYLRERREERKIGLRQMARLIRKSPNYLSMVETGLKKPSPGLLILYSRRLGIERELIFLQAGHLPGDVSAILAERPELLEKIRSGN